jgi:glycosyltransferase involved in cell wall biosynthesis
MVRTGPSFSIIIPAHNEAETIGRLLETILIQRCSKTFRVIVVPNGCTDATDLVAIEYADRLASSGSELIIHNLPQGNKAAALNTGDALAVDGHRIYMDADILLGSGVLQQVVDTLDVGGIAHCSPRIVVLPAKSWITRMYGMIWEKTPAVEQDVIGCGFYAVSASGRARWGTFPDIISDDKFARLHFSPNERAVINSCNFFIRLPEGIMELTAVRGRWCRGNNDLRRLFPRLASCEGSRYRRTAKHILRHPLLWPPALVFLAVFFLGLVAATVYKNRGVSVWERASRARQTSTPLPASR